MASALDDELTSINAIYGPGTLARCSTEPFKYILKIPDHDISLRLEFPDVYPDAPPTILGPESAGPHFKKGEANAVAEVAIRVLASVFEAGEPCIFGLLEELQNDLQAMSEDRPEPPSDVEDGNQSEANAAEQETAEIVDEPPWVLSEVFVEKKSVFVARAAAVHSPVEAKGFVRHLVNNDKKAAKATHNITAWRIRDIKSPDVTFQDCDDDGETAAGGRLLHLLQLMQIWDVIIVVTRWYGGVHLGPDRFRLINSAARDALVRGGFVTQEVSRTNKGGKS